MADLPRPARWYLYGIWMLAAVAAFLAVSFAPSLLPSPWILLSSIAVFAIADLLAVTFKVDEETGITMTLVDTLEVFLAAAFGPHGVLIPIIGSIASDLILRRPWYRGLFNASQRGLAFVLVALVYILLVPSGSAPFEGWRGLLALLFMMGIYLTLNPFFVSAIVALANNMPLWHVYTVSLKQVHWVQLITFPMGAVLAVVWHFSPWLVIPTLIPLLMAYRSFKAMAALQIESRRSKALAEDARNLAAKLEGLQETSTAMLASPEPEPLLAVVSARLSTLLNARTAWAVLAEESPCITAAHHLPSGLLIDAAALTSELQHRGVRSIIGADTRRFFHNEAPPWPCLLLIPMLHDDRLIGGFCLGLDDPPQIAADDQRVLLSFAAQAAIAIERAQLFEQLRTKQEELLRTSKLAALGTFAAGIAHEFNNLLTAISGFAQLALMSDDVVEKNQALEVAHRTSRRGQSITAGLLTFARRREARRELTQLNEVVDEILLLIERELTKASVRVVRAYEPIPPIICDSGQIAQVVMNLVTNARDAMVEKGGGTITIGLRESTEHIELWVQDTGSGIDDALLSKIFQPFFTTKQALNEGKTPGTGLGLAIIHSIVEGHRGEIAVESKSGCGTTMTVRLPLHIPTDASPAMIVTSNDERAVNA